MYELRAVSMSRGYEHHKYNNNFIAHLPTVPVSSKDDALVLEERMVMVMVPTH